MSKLTPEARAYAVAYYEAQDDQELRNILDGELGSCTYDDEDKSD